MTAGTQPEAELPDPATLWPCQISQTHCALCRRPLAEILDDRPIGSVTVGEGIRQRNAELWACAPTCETAVARRPATPPGRAAQ